MLKFKFKKNFIFLSFLLVVAPSVSSGQTLYCERESLNAKGFVDKEAAESWYPKNFEIQIDDERAHFSANSNSRGVVNKNKDNGRLEITFTVDGLSKSNIKLKFQRFTKGDPYLQVQQTAGFKELGKGFYKCDEFKSSTKKNTSTVENSENNIWEHIIDDQDGDVFIDRKNNLIMTKANFSWYNKIHERLIKNPKLDIRFDFKFQEDRNYMPKKYMFDQDIKPKIEAKIVDGIRTFIIQSNRIDELINPQGKYVRFFATDYEDGLWFVTGALKINR